MKRWERPLMLLFTGKAEVSACILTLLFSISCGPLGEEPGSECALGSEGCDCTGGGGCDLGLTCLSMLCVDLSTYRGGPDRSPAGDAGFLTDADFRDAAPDDVGQGVDSPGHDSASRPDSSIRDTASPPDSSRRDTTSPPDTSSRDSASCVSAFLGDGFCHAANNTALCGWDNGDCCESTCAPATFACGVNGYNCLDPAAAGPVDGGGQDSGVPDQGGPGSCQEFATGSTFYQGDDVYLPCNQFPPTNCRTGSYIWFDGDTETCYCALQCSDFDPVRQIGQHCDTNGDTTCLYVENSTGTSLGNWCLPQNWVDLDLDCSE